MTNRLFISQLSCCTTTSKLTHKHSEKARKREWISGRLRNKTENPKHKTNKQVIEWSQTQHTLSLEIELPKQKYNENKKIQEWHTPTARNY
jgi:uncharacterized membrane protein